MRQNIELAGHGRCHNEFLAGVCNLGENLRGSRNARVELPKFVSPSAINEDGINRIQEVIACGAVNSPIIPQSFTVGENLFRYDIDSACLSTGFVQLPEIGGRVKQDLNMIEPQNAEDTLAYPAQDEFLCVLKDDPIFHPDSRKVIDVEKPAVINFVHRRTPE